MDVIERARRYLAATPPAVSGQGGDLATHKVAVTLVKGFGLSPEAAIPLLRQWNERCLPPWGEAQLLYKVRAAARAPMPSGFMLGEAGTAGDAPAEKAAPKPEAPLFRVEPPRRPFSFDGVAHGLRMPDVHEQLRIAELRGLSANIPIFAANAGLLRVGTWQRQPAYFLLGRGVAQARRLDGAPWKFRSGHEGKTWTIGHVDSFGIGFGLGENTRRIIVTEGLVSILEALDVLVRAGEESPAIARGVGLLAAYSASRRLTRREAQYLARRWVLIIADAGPAGLTAAKAWRASIRALHGNQVRALQFDEGDLGSALRESSLCPPQIREFLEP